MGDLLYPPRIFCNVPKEFSYSSGLKFAPLAGLQIKDPLTPADRRRNLDNQTLARLAQVQHERAMAMRRLLKAHKLSIGAYATSIVSDRQTIGRMLCGITVMHEADVERMEQMIGGLHLLIRIIARRQQSLATAKQMLAIENGGWPSFRTSSAPSGLYRAAVILDD